VITNRTTDTAISKQGQTNNQEQISKQLQAVSKIVTADVTTNILRIIRRKSSSCSSSSCSSSSSSSTSTCSTSSSCSSSCSCESCKECSSVSDSNSSESTAAPDQSLTLHLIKDRNLGGASSNGKDGKKYLKKWLQNKRGGRRGGAGAKPKAGAATITAPGSSSSSNGTPSRSSNSSSTSGEYLSDTSSSA